MELIDIYLDEECKKKVEDAIEFDIVSAGKKEERYVYIKNNTGLKMIVHPLVLGEEDVKLLKRIFPLDPKSIEKIILEINTKVTRLKPLRFILKIKIESVAEI